MNPNAIVECVPNFSTARDPAVLQQITDAIRAVDGVTLLDVDPGEATNRTVVTFVGAPESVLEAAFQGIATASRLIDMAQHTGAHPRMGATDVCPFVPVRGVTMEACAELARRLGERVGSELGVPVYLYERAATSPDRQNLATIRTGEYEGLKAKLADPAWAPDFGPAAWSEGVARTGATVIGARPFLIAYNVNLNTRTKRLAMKLAALVREKGILIRDANNEIVRDSDGVAQRRPGLFTHVKAIGWYIEEYGCCQVSINFTDHTISPIHEVVDALRRLAAEHGVVVTGSELVGLIPLSAMLAAGRHYLTRQGGNPGAPESELVEVAIRSLGLRDLGPFDPDKAIIDRRITTDGPLVADTVRGFVDKLSSDAPAPGGGSVAALCGAMSTGLSAMVSQLTTGKPRYAEQRAAHMEMAPQAQTLKEAFLNDVDADTAAFDGIMAAFALPRKTPGDKAARRAAIQAATVTAIEIPLRVLERSVDAIGCAEVAATGNANARSDAGVAALTAVAAAEGAYYNVLINLQGFKDAERAAQWRARADEAYATVIRRAAALTAQVRADLGA